MTEDIKTRWVSISKSLITSILRKELIIGSDEEVFDAYYNEMSVLRFKVRRVKS